MIYYYLMISNKIEVYKSRIMRKLTDTADVKVIENGESKDILGRYYVVRAIDYVMNRLKNLRDMCDVEAEKIQITKRYEEGDQKIILASETEDESVGVVDILNHIDRVGETKSDHMGHTIFVNFELETEGGVKCLKKYLVKYKDSTKSHHHTLENILHFNEIDIDKNDEVKVRIKYFKNGEIKEMILNFKDISDEHISYFYELE